MAKVPPAMWENPAAFTPDEAAENETERPDEAAQPEPQPDDGSFKRIAKEDDEAVGEPEEPRH